MSLRDRSIHHENSGSKLSFINRGRFDSLSVWGRDSLTIKDMEKNKFKFLATSWELGIDHDDKNQNILKDMRKVP